MVPLARPPLWCTDVPQSCRFSVWATRGGWHPVIPELEPSEAPGLGLQPEGRGLVGMWRSTV